MVIYKIRAILRIDAKYLELLRKMIKNYHSVRRNIIYSCYFVRIILLSFRLLTVP